MYGVVVVAMLLVILLSICFAGLVRLSPFPGKPRPNPLISLEPYRYH